MRSPSYLYRLAALLTLGVVLTAAFLQPARAQAQEPARPSRQVSLQNPSSCSRRAILPSATWNGIRTPAPCSITCPARSCGLGDNAYNTGSLQEFNDCYGPTWGRHKDRVYPCPATTST